MARALPATTALPAASDPAFERFARLVRHQLRVPVALVTLVSVDQQVFPGALGLPEPYQSARCTPLSHSFCQHVVRSGQPLVVTDARLEPLVQDNPAIHDLSVVAYAGMPLVDADGQVVGSLCAIDSQPRTWAEDDLAMLADLADACSSELQLRALRHRAVSAAAEAEVATRQARELLVQHDADRTRWELALDSGRIGSFDLDLSTGRLSWDQRVFDLLGVAAEEFDHSMDSFSRAVHPADADRVRAAVERAVATCGQYEAEFRVRRNDGETRWVQARGRVLPDAAGQAAHLTGAAYDTTSVHDGEARTSRVLEAMPSGFLSLDVDWCFTVLNAAAEKLLGRSRETLAGRSVFTEFPETVGTEFEAAFRRAVDTGLPQTLTAFYPAPLSAWFEVLCWPTVDGLSLFFTDVTQRTLDARRAESSGARLALLAQANNDLATATDVEAATAGLARLLVPTLTDACLVTLVEADGRPRDVASWHVDPDVRPMLQEYSATRIQHMPVTAPLARVLATGQPVVTSGTELSSLLTEGPASDLLPRLGVAHGVVLPIRGRDRVLGALSLFCGPDRPRDLDDEATAADIADRTALALDNARLLTTQSQVAEGLQRSLLTQPPEPDHAEIVVRYVPASVSARVGGDWYDAFLQSGGATMLVIGDVVGHDIEAAAAMGQLRGLLRGVATYSDAGPAEVLRGLDASMQLLQIPTLATAAVARLEQTPAELAAGTTRLVWSNAGHMPPVVLAADGSLTVLAAERADLLLGVAPETRRTEHTALLERGSTVLLFTDGLVERRRSDLDADMARLQQAVGELLPGTLDELCDGLIDQLVHGRNDDDIALVAVRLHPQDQPRPASAGPNVQPVGLPPDPAGRASSVAPGAGVLGGAVFTDPATDLVIERDSWSGTSAPDPSVTEGLATSWALREPRELTLLRRSLRARLEEVEGPEEPTGATLRVLSAVEELASNGLRHGRPPVRLTVTRSAVGWLVSVTDTASEVVPLPAVGRDPALGGLGLVMIDQLCDAHGWYVDGDGKHVWGLVSTLP